MQSRLASDDLETAGSSREREGGAGRRLGSNKERAIHRNTNFHSNDNAKSLPPVGLLTGTNMLSPSIAILGVSLD